MTFSKGFRFIYTEEKSTNAKENDVKENIKIRNREKMLVQSRLADHHAGS